MGNFTVPRALRGSLAALLVAGALVVGDEREADACGACFSSANESTIVSDHKMALAITKQQTILWDQITYTGNPSAFAYVIPARQGTRVEASTDPWFQALDASTRPIIMAPVRGGYGGGYAGRDGYGGGGGNDGCGCGSSESASFLADNAGAPSGGAAGGQQREPVQIVDQATVGPYETITLRSSEPEALPKWLRDHGFRIPAEATPILEDYVKQGLDFIAMRLQPGTEVRAMQPIRIVTPGADVRLPLRMMKIGIGAKVGVTLYVIAEGRYHPKNLPDVQVDYTSLIWDYNQNRSNYQELSKKAMESGNGDGFITEYADHPNLEDTGMTALPQGGTMNPGLADAYRMLCVKGYTPAQDAGVKKDSGVDASIPSDAGDPDAGDPDAGDLDGGVSEAGAPDASVPIDHPPTHDCDDLEVAVKDLAKKDVWITRLRANLPAGSLDAPLELEPTPQQAPIGNVHQTTNTGTIQARIARGGLRQDQGTWVVVGVTVVALGRLLAKRRKKA